MFERSIALSECRGTYVADQDPLDALFAAITNMFDTSDIMPKKEKTMIVLSKPGDRMIVYGWKLPWIDIEALRIGACTGSVTTFFRKQASEIRPVERAKRDSINAREHDAMLGQECMALMRGFDLIPELDTGLSQERNFSCIRFCQHHTPHHAKCREGDAPAKFIESRPQAV